MKILALEPFFGGSHRLFLEGYRRFSRHEIEIATMPARKWKWRMRGAALHYADLFRGRWREFDLLLASDFLGLADLVALAPADLAKIPKALYFHENQLTYPYREESERDYQFGFTNITSCLAADQIFFNSAFHREEFLGAIEPFLKRLPDLRPPGVGRAIAEKSGVLPLGLDLDAIRAKPRPERRGPPTILWNHRWEFDKNPELFFETLFRLKTEGLNFRLAVAGEHFRETPPIFDHARETLRDRIVHFGFLESRAAYLGLLRSCDIVCSTAIHEFFGVSVLEAVAAGCRPVLPNRLSYPEMLPPETHNRYLYAADAAFPGALQRAIEKAPSFRPRDAERLADTFGWKELAPRYDDAFDAMPRAT